MVLPCDYYKARMGTDERIEMLWEEDPSTDELNPVQEEVVREYIQDEVLSFSYTTEAELETITNEMMEKLREKGLLHETLKSIIGPRDSTVDPVTCWDA